MILMPLFLPPFPNGIQGKPQHHLPLQWLWKRDAESFDEIPHSFHRGGFPFVVSYVPEQKVPKVDAEASDLHPRHKMAPAGWK